MEQPSKKVNLKPVDADKIKIEKIAAFEEAYAFELELDSTQTTYGKRFLRTNIKQASTA